MSGACVETRLVLASAWKKIKTIPFLQKLIASIYYYFYRVSTKIQGSNNILHVELNGSFPFLKNVSFNIFGKDNIVIIKSGVNLESLKINIYGFQNKLVIEDNCHISGGCLWLEDSQCQLIIGKGTTIVGATIGVSEPNSSVTIGEDCMLADGIDIRCGDSHSIIDIDCGERINYAQNIYIGKHVWLARNVQILKGVNIGDNSIIATGSIVTKDVPNNCLVAGIPAQIKRTRVNWLREKISITDVD